MDLDNSVVIAMARGELGWDTSKSIGGIKGDDWRLDLGW